jgi:hypothetical protein
VLSTLGVAEQSDNQEQQNHPTEQREPDNCQRRRA